MTTVFLSLGSNLNDREKNIRAAIAALMNSGTLSDTKSSSLYESEPWGNRDQPWFVNCVIKGTTALGPYALLMKLLAIETQFGRVRAPETKWQPRTLDIDILLYGRLALQMPTTRPKAKQLMPRSAVADVVATNPKLPALTIPHEHLAERRFVLLPLAELASDFVHPGTEKPISQLLKECVDHSIVKPFLT